MTKHIYTNHTLVATIEADTPAPKTYYNHQDHLNSTNAVTDKDGYLNQLLSYQPFGDTRIDEQYGSINQHRQYLGETKDEETGLNYLGSRYENGQTARFTSQDQANLDLGAQSWEDTYSRPLDVFLRDPQQFNTYSYARNNPMIISDPNGNIIPLAIAAVMAGLTAYDAYTTGQTVSDPNASLGDKAIAVALFASPAGEVKAGGKVVGNVADKLADVRRKGSIGEVVSGIQKNTEKIPDLIKGNGKQRIPDGLNHQTKTLQEVKNVKYQSNTAQLRAFTEYSKQNGYTMELITRPTTKLSKPLQQSLDNTGAKVTRKELNQ
ncbi:MAG: putative toxin [Candidatus Paceibacterota bacterium]